jgi:hypothetical protein
MRPISFRFGKELFRENFGLSDLITMFLPVKKM